MSSPCPRAVSDRLHAIELSGDINGRYVRERRESGGLSREALGSLTGVHPTAIQRFEKGRRDPRLTSILRLARGLRLPPRVLVEDDAERPDPPVADAA